MPIDPATIEQRKLAEKEHNALAFLGLRAQATAAGLIQLCAELKRAGVLGDDAVDRIKGAIVDDLGVSMPSFRNREDAERRLKERIDQIFDRRIKAGDERGPRIGSSEEVGEALGFGGPQEASPRPQG